MRAVQITRLDGPDSLEVVEVDEPQPSQGQVLLEVHAAGVTFPDLLLSRGEYQIKPPLPFTPGSEVAGVVLSAPADSNVKVGDRVAAFPFFSGFQEKISVDPDVVFRIPQGMSFAKAAALPMNYLTVEFAFLRRGRLRAGETVLVQGAAGGVGTAAIQLAKALGARVIAVVSTESKASVARTAGADEVVLLDGFLPAVKKLTGGRGVDIVMDPVGGDRFTDSLRSLAPEGRLLVVGFTGGEIPTVKVNRLLLNNIDVVGVGWGALAMSEPGYLQRQWTTLWPFLESGALDPPLGNSYPLERAGEALRELAERRARGKVILQVR